MSHTNQFRTNLIRAVLWALVIAGSLVSAGWAPAQVFQPMPSAGYDVVHGWPVLPEEW